MKTILRLLAVATLAVADVGKISTGTSILVRSSQAIDAKKSDGQIFNGVVDQDVTDVNGYVAIPKGSAVELIVKKAANKELNLDLESVTVRGQRYAVSSDASQVSSSQRDGIRKGKRTAEYLGVGAVAGTGAGAGEPVLARDKSVKVLSESLLTFRLNQTLGISAADNGFVRNGRHYHRNK